MERKHGAEGHTAQTASGEYWGESEELAQGRLTVNSFTFMFNHKRGWNIHPFTSDRLSSNLALSDWLGTLPRTSVIFTTDCSTLPQEPVEEQQQKHGHLQVFARLFAQFWQGRSALPLVSYK